MRRIVVGRSGDCFAGLWQAGKYSLGPVMVALAGCTGRPNMMAVSRDGRYVVVPINERGVAAPRKELVQGRKYLLSGRNYLLPGRK